MLELRETAAQFNIDALVIRLDSNDCTSMILPCIALFRSAENAVSKHHYVVVYKIDERVHFVDATTGQKISSDFQWFSQHWTGYALMRHKATVPLFLKRFVLLSAAFYGVLKLGPLLAMGRPILEKK